MPQFTIIIPTYNSGKNTRECLDSILNQSFKDFEIIIQDGISTDNTIAVIESYNDTRIKIFIEKDQGVYDAMNKAIDKSSGEWILFLGSDDSLYNNHVLQEVNHYLTINDADLVYGNVKIVGSNEWAKDGEIYRGEISIPVLFEHNFSHQSIFYNKIIFNDGHKYNLDYKVCADHDFNLFCASRYRVKYIPIIVALFSTGGLSSVVSDQLFEEEKWVNIIRYYRRKLLDTQLKRYKRVFKEASKSFFDKRHFSLWFLSLRIYFYFKTRKG